MAFQAAPWAIDGATNDAVLARLQLQSGTQSKSGVVSGGDLKVSALATPAAQVTIGSGAFVANGAEASWQGSYYAYNIGAVSVNIAAQGASGPRSDLIVARIEDPTISGSPWSHNPATDPLVYPVVISGVSSTQTTLPSGTGVPLARIDLPANTSAVTQSMITDLRQIANPRTERQLYILTPTVLDNMHNGDPSRVYPQQAIWSVPVPSWATKCQVIGTWNQLMAISSGGVGPWCKVQVKLGSKTTRLAVFDSSTNTSVDPYRSSGSSADTLDVSSMAGTTQTLNMLGQGAGSGTAAIWASDTSSCMTVDLNFIEGVV